MTDPREAVLTTYERNVEARRLEGAPSERYIHFGHWETPPRAGTEKEGFVAAQERLDAAIRRVAKVGSGMAIRDAGCGFGGTLEAIDASFEQVRMVGLNLDPRQLAVASAAFTPRPGNTVAWLEGDASDLGGFDDTSFDRILAVESIVHFASRRRFVQSAARVLRRSGRLAITDIVATPELRALRGSSTIPFDVERIVATGLQPWPDFWGEDVDYEQLAASAGLRLELRIDATLQTMPSYRAILGQRTVEPATHAGDEGMLLLEWLQARGLVRVLYVGLEKPAR